MDGTRIVISNDDWEHARSDLLSVHDYNNDAEQLSDNYRSLEVARRNLTAIAPNGKRMLIGTDEENEYMAARPIVLSEFGGVSLYSSDARGWGYHEVASRTELEKQLATLFAAAQSCGALAGWCYTQLTDTAQETNGLLDEHREPKIPIEQIRAIVTGTAAPELVSRMEPPEEWRNWADTSMRIDGKDDGSQDGRGHDRAE
jgi:hypothetical protein